MSHPPQQDKPVSPWIGFVVVIGFSTIVALALPKCWANVGETVDVDVHVGTIEGEESK